MKKSRLNYRKSTMKGMHSKEKIIRDTGKEIEAIEKVEKIAEKTRQSYEFEKQKRKFLRFLDLLAIIFVILAIYLLTRIKYFNTEFWLLLISGILAYILVRIVLSRR